jgi:hypothetical protein
MNTNSLYELFEIEYCARISKGRFLKSHIYSIFDVFARPKNVISKANVIHVKDVVHRIIERSEQKQFTTNSTNSNYLSINVQKEFESVSSGMDCVFIISCKLLTLLNVLLYFLN